eukprot:TRINITY_DN5599_c0_g3_i1.p1 TRINITY_DN5599_c0_g3~~TRINITY_DN5599_c0_g3_i1.p1  ORF type:complete len:424 (+),score=60.83 TRINITY_DN5599_c0_g3_i1:72-1343(+)
MSGEHVVAFNISAPGHFYPTLPLLKELIYRGAKLTYLLYGLSAESFVYCQKAIETIGGVAVNLYDVTSWRNTEPGLLSMFTGAMNSDEVISWFSSLEPTPTCVFNDPFGVNGFVIAKKFHLPLVTSISFCPFTWTVPFPPSVQELKSKYEIDLAPETWLHKNLPLTNRDAFNIMHTVKSYVEHVIPEEVSKKICFAGCPFLPRSWEEEGNDEFIVNVMNYKKSGKKIFYVSLGTVVVRRCNDNEMNFKSFVFRFFDFLVRVIEENEDVECFIPFVDSAKSWLEGKELPKNFHVCSYVPQLKLLPLTDAFLTHGGANSITESLYFGVPTIVLPFFGDQMFNAESVVRCGVGLSFPYNEGFEQDESNLNPNRDSFTYDNLSRAVKHVLRDETIKGNCKKLSEVFQSNNVSTVIQSVLDWLLTKRS